MYDRHVALGAKMAPFANYLMPIEYTGIIGEHRDVRTRMGMFDLSHMGELRVTGDDALSGVDGLMTNSIANLEIWQARYTPMCTPDGGIVDDLLVYRFPDWLMLVVNASNIEKDLAWVRDHLPSGVQVIDESERIALIAVQGPLAPGFVQSLTGDPMDQLGYYHFLYGEISGIGVTISRTGYTGEDGVELYVRERDAGDLWDVLWRAGQPKGLAAIGLGARDTLRLEAGLALYGNDIDETTAPLEAGLGWTVKLDGREFIGADALRRLKDKGLSRRLVAFEMLDRSIPRSHCEVIVNGERAGHVSSGTFSPTFAKGMGLAYVPAVHSRVDTAIDIDIRGQTHPARIMKKPIYQRA
ncbi:MAG TPA: glycine cleavage system aminomethyltransferase GcvT [Chloroflexota bacterium]|nr:glycine cleavage system aminomethyltransferase GcvT [Chloroflexota bacterium]